MNAAYGLLLKQALYDRRTLGSLWMTWLLLAVAALLFVGCVAAIGNWRLGALLASIALGANAFLWWGMLVRIAVAQNLPSHACLVPRLRRQLMEMLVGVFCIVAVPLAALASLQLGHFGYVLVVFALLFPFVLLVQRYTWLGIFPAIVIFSLNSWAKGPAAQAAQWLAAHNESGLTLVALAAVAALGAWSLGRALPAGGDAHSDWHRNFTRRVAATRRGVPASAGSDVNGTNPVAALVGRWSRWRYGGSPARLLAGRKMLAGIGIDSGGWVGVVTTPLAAAVCWLVLGALFPTLGVSSTGMGLPLIEGLTILSTVTWVQSATTAVLRRTGEQSLLRLAPATPAVSDLNRVLGRMLLQRWLAVWVASAACVLLAEALAAGRPVVTGFGLLLVALPLPTSLGMVRDYAAMPRGRDPSQSGTVVLMLAYIMLMGLGRGAVLSSAWCWMLALTLAVATLILLRRRWRQMMEAPVAFPACRLAP